MFAEGLAKGDFAVVVETCDEPFQRDFGGADTAHGVVDAAGTETALRDFVASAVAEDEVAGWDADVFECDVAVAVGWKARTAELRMKMQLEEKPLGGNKVKGFEKAKL